MRGAVRRGADRLSPVRRWEDSPEGAVSRPRLLAAGGAHIDRRGRLTVEYVAEASNPGQMREDVGGGAFNAARWAVRRDIAVSLVSLRGGDASGERVALAIEEAGIEDLSATYLDRATPSYTAILTREGELVTGLADMELYEIGFPKQLRRRKVREAAREADALLADTNMPEEALALFAGLAPEKPLFAIAVSPAKAPRLLPSFGRISCLYMNRREACRLAGLSPDAEPRAAAEALASLGLSAGIITRGGKPTVCFDQGMLFEIAPPPVSRIADVTGAGDALAGATVAALMRGLSLAEAVREGLAAAMLTVESEEASPETDEAAFRAALAQVPQPRMLT